MTATPRISGSQTVRARQDAGTIDLDAIVAEDPASSLDLRRDGLWSRALVHDCCALRLSGLANVLALPAGSTPAPVEWDEVAFATKGMYAGSSAPSRVKIVNGGTYLISASGGQMADSTADDITTGPLPIGALTATPTPAARLEVWRHRSDEASVLIDSQGTYYAGPAICATVYTRADLKAGDELEVLATGWVIGLSWGHFTVVETNNDDPIQPRINVGNGGLALSLDDGNLSADTILSAAADNGLKAGPGGLYADRGPQPTQAFTSTVFSWAFGSGGQMRQLFWGPTATAIWQQGITADLAGSTFTVPESGVYEFDMTVGVDVVTVVGVGAWNDTNAPMTTFLISTLDLPYRNRGAGAGFFGIAGVPLIGQTFMHPQNGAAPALSGNQWMTSTSGLFYLEAGARIIFNYRGPQSTPAPMPPGTRFTTFIWRVAKVGP